MWQIKTIAPSNNVNLNLLNSAKKYPLIFDQQCISRIVHILSLTLKTFGERREVDAVNMAFATRKFLYQPTINKLYVPPLKKKILQIDREEKMK